MLLSCIIAAQPAQATPLDPGAATAKTISVNTGVPASLIGGGANSVNWFKYTITNSTQLAIDMSNLAFWPANGRNSGQYRVTVYKTSLSTGDGDSSVFGYGSATSTKTYQLAPGTYYIKVDWGSNPNQDCIANIKIALNGVNQTSQADLNNCAAAIVAKFGYTIRIRTIATIPVPIKAVPVAVYRVYNKHSGLHHYTKNLHERNVLVGLGWRDEGVSFRAAEQGSAPGLLPVYREYNPHDGNHNWTLNRVEHNTLVSLGWHDEGVAWYTSPTAPLPVYRLYNPHSGEHVYTISKLEYTVVGAAGWHQEGVAWRGL
jgi:hypothetical protein